MERSDREKICVILAAYNESLVVNDVVSELRGMGYSVILVDDGSADGTGEAAYKAGANVVRHAVNLGQGAALQTGIECAIARGARFVVTFDSDGQHQAADIELLIKALIDTGADIACGSRFLGRALNIPRPRRAFLKVAAIFTGLTTGVSLSDAHNGLRAMTSACARKIRIRQNRMAHASEIISEISRNSLRYVEVPVTIRYTSYSLSKGQSLGNAVAIILDLLARGMFK